MNKIYFVLIFLLFILQAITAFSQVTSGKINYIVTHDWVKKIAAVDYMSKSTKEKYNYVWGNRSEYKTKSVLSFNQKAARYEEINEGYEDNEYKFSWRTDEYVIYRDFINMKSYDLIRYSEKLYVVEDSIRNQNWKILNDVREIAGHICMNASYRDTLKMNTIIAWFALDIPVPGGPERFGGLPGMILEIDVNNGAMIISAENIITENSVEISKPEHKKKVKVISVSDYDNILYQKVKECRDREEPYFWDMRY